ncbi:MAG: hypothetical protein DDT25_01358 [Chloroflexi bacterium]|nr:hypothetical protein [Chloroflexota bacterium]
MVAGVLECSPNVHQTIHPLTDGEIADVASFAWLRAGDSHHHRSGYGHGNIGAVVSRGGLAGNINNGIAATTTNVPRDINNYLYFLGAGSGQMKFRRGDAADKGSGGIGALVFIWDKWLKTAISGLSQPFHLNYEVHRRTGLVDYYYSVICAFPGGNADHKDRRANTEPRCGRNRGTGEDGQCQKHCRQQDN